MIEVDAIFTRETVREMSKGKRIGNFIIFPLIAAAMLTGGIISLVRGVSGFELVGAIIMIAGAPLVVLMTIFFTRSEEKSNLASFGVDGGDVRMNYKFSESAVVITRVARGKVDREKLLYKELYKVKRTKNSFRLYVNKDEMFYVPAKEENFVSGTAEELFKIFYESKVILDY